MLNVSLVLHANLQYAEIPSKEIPRVIKESYLPTLKGLLKIPQSKIAFNFTGVTLEILEKEYPEIIDLIKKGIEKGQFELLGFAYSQPILPLIQEIDINLHIKKHLELLERLLGVKNPQGFFLPEAAWSPNLAPILKKFGFSWTMIDYDHLALSQTAAGESVSIERKPIGFTERGMSFYTTSFFKQIASLPSLALKFRHDISDPDFEPVIIQGAGAEISAVLMKQVWSPLYFGASLAAPKALFWLLSPNRFKKRLKKMAQSGKVKGLVIPFGSDFEIIGYRGNIPASIPVEKFLDIVSWATSEKDINLTTPTTYLKKNPPKKKVYLRTGSWAPDRSLKVWDQDPDDKKLNRLCDEARSYLIRTGDSKEAQKGWHHLLLAENSDGRGWNPVPERRLFCYEHALKAIEIGKRLTEKAD
ncbi:MAG: hypothetical protein MUP45_02930 [Candidatus Marinimicrobia bacterium]|nr:hypothetical protein [Candidatus Neomarinimicrobiota bacterium]